MADAGVDEFAGFAPAPSVGASPPADEFAGFATAPAPDETAGRVAGLGARALGAGVAGYAGYPQMAADAVKGLVDPAGLAVDKASRDTSSRRPQLSDFVHPDRWQQAAEYFASKGADAAGLPTPGTNSPTKPWL